MKKNIRASLFHYFLRHPEAAAAARQASYLWWRFTIAMKRLASRNRENPDRLIHVSPTSIAQYIGGSFGNRFRTRGTVLGGDWDRAAKPFEDWDVFRAIRDHLSGGAPWSASDYYQRVKGDLAKGGTLYGAESVDQHFTSLDALSSDIMENGFRPAAEATTPGVHSRDPLGKYREYDDITVAVDRHGRFLLQDGKHRLSIAKVLKLPEIPVAVGMRHSKWSEFKDEVASFCTGRGGFAYQPFTHPDLQEFRAQHADDRHVLIEKHLARSQGTLLDIGAYFGYFSCYFAHRGWKCTAVEHHPKHTYFIRKLVAAENLDISLVQKTFLDLEAPLEYDAVLALNIFHHCLQTKALFEKLKAFLKKLKTRQLFFEPHLPDDEIVRGSYMNFEPPEFARFVANHSGLPVIEDLGETSRGRRLYLLTADGSSGK